jgi:GNAT superfamily N-acetyltransferase
MIIKEIDDKQEKKEISTRILESLPNWFGIQESTQEYISKSSNLPFFAAIDESNPLGFIAIKENNRYTVEIYVMGVLPNYHNQGIGRSLLKRVLQWAKEEGYEFLQVKTLDESHPDIYYAKTRKFYTSVGFKPLECLPELWGRENPCLIMIQHIV